MVKRKNVDQDPEGSSASKRTTRSTMDKCKVCLEQVVPDFIDEDKITLLCRECNDRYHGDCVGVSSKFFYNLIQNGRKGWACYSCHQNKLQFLDSIEKRVRDMEEVTESNSIKISSVQSSCERALVAMDEKIADLKQSLLEEIELVKSSGSGGSQTPSIDEIVNTVVSRQSSSLSNSDDVTFLRALHRKNNLVIQNVPVINGENAQVLNDIVVKIAACFGYDLDRNNIVIVIRLRNRASSESGSSTGSNPQRPFSNSLLVKLSDITVKDDFFNSYISAVILKKYITGTNVGLNSNQRIFINHHLSPELSKIKIKASELKKSGFITKINARYDCIKVFVNNSWHKVTNFQALEDLSSMDQ